MDRGNSRKGFRDPVMGLRKNGLYRLDIGPCERVVRCLRGTLWITQEGDPNDYVLTQGKCLVADHTGCLLIQALDKAFLRIGKPGRDTAGARVRPLLKEDRFQGDEVPGTASGPGPGPACDTTARAVSVTWPGT